MKTAIYLLIGFTTLLLVSCHSNESKKSENIVTESNDESSSPKYSLAQWSFNKELFRGKMSTVDFINKTGELDFDGVEYVSQFFQEKVEDFEFLDSLNAATKEAGVKSLLIMVDGAGNLGASDMVERNRALENHKKWVDAAKYLGCTSIRINAHGDGTDEEIMNACEDGITRLAQYAESQNMNVIIENHGGPSNNGAWLAELIQRIDMDNLGSLPDFNNWCSKFKNSKMYGDECLDRYDRYLGVKELLLYAKALSVKSFGFDEKGYETTIDYVKMFEIIQSSDYDGYMGIEYEGHDLPSEEGIIKTRDLVEKVWK